MFGNINSKQVQKVMKQMGLSQEDIETLRVIIEKPNGKIIIEKPNVAKIKMQGQEMFQISGGEISEEKEISEEDINTIIEKTGVSKEKAKEVLEKTGDLADAILKLNE